VVDEVGKMECFSPLFVEQMETLLDGSTPLLATVAIKGSGFIAQVKQRAGVELLEVTSRNRDELVDKLAEQFRHAIARRLPT
jgi:nucleoside-triphosphatase